MAYCLTQNTPLPKVRPKSTVTFLNNEDYERIKKSARLTTEEEVKSDLKIIEQQKECQKAKARAHIDLLKHIDKMNPRRTFTKYDKAKENDTNNILAAAKKAKIDNMDAVKEMDKLLKYSKVVTVRDMQRNEHQKMEELWKNKEKKMDLMMELERLKELKFLENKEKLRKRQQIQSGKMLIEQIKQKDIRRLHEREAILREGELMKKQMAAMKLEDFRREENRKREQERMAKEIVTINKLSILNKEKQLLAEREEDLKNLKYNMDKAKKEEEEVMEKKRVQAEREKETQKLREKQERAIDKQAQIDELRAKRAYIEAERKARQKEIDEIMKLKRQKEELIKGYEIQKEMKREQLNKIALEEQKDYENMKKKQIKENENERRIEEDYKKLCLVNGDEVRKQIVEKEEKRKELVKEVKEEGRQMKQAESEYMKMMQKIKKDKLGEMEKYHIEPKYRVDLERYKIK